MVLIWAELNFSSGISGALLQVNSLDHPDPVPSSHSTRCRLSFWAVSEEHLAPKHRLHSSTGVQACYQPSGCRVIGFHDRTAKAYPQPAAQSVSRLPPTRTQPWWGGPPACAVGVCWNSFPGASGKPPCPWRNCSFKPRREAGILSHWHGAQSGPSTRPPCPGGVVDPAPGTGAVGYRSRRGSL
jgi:hypothetical protein